MGKESRRIGFTRKRCKEKKRCGGMPFPKLRNHREEWEVTGRGQSLQMGTQPLLFGLNHSLFP